MRFILLFYFLTLTVLSHGQYYPQRDPLETILEWKLLEYAFPNENDRQQALAAGNLVPENAAPIDVAIVYAANKNSQDRIFVTIPRFSTGIPFTLATYSPDGQVGRNGPMLKAYPNYNWHKNSSGCDGIISAFRVNINECNQMWVIDSGVIGSTQVCPPQLLLFDLSNDNLIHRYRFDSSLYAPGASLFITPISVLKRDANKGSCQESMVYVADVGNHGLVVYDYKNQRAWRVESRWMYPNPDYGNHTIAGESFVLMDGIFALTTDRMNLYFHPLASISEFSVPLSVLNDASNFANGATAQEYQFRKLGSRLNECATEAIDSQGNIYCVTFNPIDLISWNVRQMYYSPRTIANIPADTRLLQFVSGMKVVRNKAGMEELWMMSNRYQKIAAGTLNKNEINFRVLKRPLYDVQSYN